MRRLKVSHSIRITPPYQTIKTKQNGQGNGMSLSFNSILTQDFFCSRVVLCRRDRFLLQPTLRIFFQIESYFSFADLAFRGCSEGPTPSVHFLQVCTI